MTASFYMSRGLIWNEKIDKKLRRLEGLKAAATRTTATMQEDVVTKTRNVHSMADLIDKKVDLEREIDADIDRLADVKAELMQMIAQVTDPVSQSVLELRFVCFKKWDEIASVLGYNRRSIFKVRLRALEEVQSIIDSEPEKGS